MSATPSLVKGLVAAAVLVLVQISIGLSFKLSQNHGHYDFSQASSLTLTECIKLAISIAFYKAELQSRIASRRVLLPLSTRTASNEKEEAHSLLRSGSQEKEEAETPLIKQPESTTSENLPIPLDNSRQALYDCWRREVSAPGIIAGFFGLALLYAINNHTVFFVYRLADPGTIQLVKASTTIISATTMRLFLARGVREMQWHALIVQTCGLLVTQMGNISLSYAPSTYALLLGMTCISAIAGVWNDHLCKSYTASLHAENIIMYLGGIFLNLTVYMYKKTTDWEGEPGFFSGYGSLGAIGLMLLNAMVGIVITTVYKYADAIMKCVATSVTTAFMLIISSAFFGVEMGRTPLTGCAIVFLSSYTYIRAGMKPTTTTITLADGRVVNKPKLQKQVALGYFFLGTIIVSIIYTCYTYGIRFPGEAPAPVRVAASTTGSWSLKDVLDDGDRRIKRDLIPAAEWVKHHLSKRRLS